MRIGLVEFLLILAIASLTIGPQVALFVDRWMRRANRCGRKIRAARVHPGGRGIAVLSAAFQADLIQGRKCGLGCGEKG